MALRARDIADLCDDLAIERASVTVKEGWDHSPQLYLTFGPLAYRQTMLIEPNWGTDDVRGKLEAARASPLVGVAIPAPEAKLSPAATPAPAISEILATREYADKQWTEPEVRARKNRGKPLQPTK